MNRGFTFVLILLLLMGMLYEFSQAQVFAVVVASLLVLALCAVDLVQALGLLLFAIALSPEIQMLGIPIRIEDLIIPVILLFAVVRMGSRRIRLKPTGLRLPIFLFLFFMLTSTLHAVIVNPNLDQIPAIFHFLKHVEYILIFLLALNVVNESEDLRFLSYCLIGAALTLALQAAYSPLGLIGSTLSGSPGVVSEGGEQVQRLHGVATETANIFGGYLVFHILFALGILIENDSVPRKLFLGGIVVIMAYPLLFTMSRSSYTGLVAGIIFLGLFRDLKLLFAVGLAGFAALSVLPATVIERFLSIFQTLTEANLAPSWQARLEAWQEYIPVIIQNPFLGKGLFYITPGEVDNEFILRGVETGILGLMSFLWVFVSFFRRSLSLFESEEAIFRQIGVGYTGAVIGLSVHSLAATSFTAIRTAEPLYFTSGLIVAAYLLHLNIGRQHTTVELRQKETARKAERVRSKRIRSQPS